MNKMDINTVKLICATTVFSVGGLVEYYTTKNTSSGYGTGLGWGSLMAILILC